MSRYYKIIFMIPIFMMLSCGEDKEIIAPDLKQGEIKITTDNEIYYWRKNSGYKILTINGNLQNNSNKSYLSNVGDNYGSTDFIFFARGSDGNLEKYNSIENKWYEEDELLGFLIEGTSSKEIESSRIYHINAALYIDTLRYPNEIGKYRLRIDYYDILDEAKIFPFHDYSNVFEIR